MDIISLNLHKRVRTLEQIAGKSSGSQVATFNGLGLVPAGDGQGIDAMLNPNKDRNIMRPLADRLINSYDLLVNERDYKDTRHDVIANIIGAYADQKQWKLHDRFARVRQIIEQSDLTGQELDVLGQIHDIVMSDYNKRISGKEKTDYRSRVLEESDKISMNLRLKSFAKRPKSGLKKLAVAASIGMAALLPNLFQEYLLSGREIAAPRYTAVFLSSEVPLSLHTQHAVEIHTRGHTSFSHVEWGKYIEYKTGLDYNYIKGQIESIYAEAKRLGRNPTYAVVRAIVRTEWLKESYNRQTTPTREQLISSILQAEKEQGNIPQGILFDVIETESNLNVRAISHKGAQGLGQLMPITQIELGVTNPFDPFENIEASARYLNKMFTKTAGETSLALAAYYSGFGDIKQRLSNDSGVQAYVERVYSNRIWDGTSLAILREFTGFVNSNLHGNKSAKSN